MSQSLFDLSGEIAVVIGATGALGGALAEGLAAAGAAVAVLGRNKDRGEACAGRISGKGGKANEGFDWGSAAIGAGIAGALLLLIAAGASAAAHRGHSFRHVSH